MRRNETITIDLYRGDCFTAAATLKKIEGIAGVSVVTCKQIRVKYKIGKTSPEVILNHISGTIVKN